MRAFSRFGCLVIAGTFSLITIALLLSSRVSTRLQSLGLGDWVSDWGNPNKTELAVVVFGDSWVDDGVVLEQEEGFFSLGGGKEKESNRHPEQGPSWTEVLCKELKCTSYYNFASSAPITVSSPPSGVLTSNEIFKNGSSQPGLTPTSHNPSLPDLPTQISSYLSVARSLPPTKTLFIISFGIWDTYHYSSLAPTKELTEQFASSSIDAIFSQLDVLFSAFATKAEDALSDKELELEKSTIHDFQVVLPELVDPTLLPGWRTARPLPLPPTSVAEEQKLAVTFVEKWNSYLQEKIKKWVQETPLPAPSKVVKSEGEDKEETKSQDGETRKDEGQDSAENDEHEEELSDDLAPPPLLWKKTIHHPDLSTYFVDSLRTKYLEDHKVFDANGLGTQSSPYESVVVPCAPVAGFEELKRDGRTMDGKGIDVDGHCGDAERWLFWDEWDLGPRGQREVGRAVGGRIREENLKAVVGKEGDGES